MRNRIMGVYRITNIINGKIYIGSSVDIDERWKEHVRDLKKGRHHSNHLQRAWNKYGQDNFKFEAIELVDNEDILQSREQSWINKTKCYDGNVGYNLSMDANRPLILPDILATHMNCNLVFRDRVIEIVKLKLEVNEKLVYYVLRDFIAYPSNCVLINGEVPQMTDLEPLIGLKERTIRKALKGLEEKGVIKLLRSGVRKAIYFNPYYYASGKELDINTLKIFDLVECDDDKIEQYINENKNN